MDYESMTNSALSQVHNELAGKAGRNVLTGPWKGKKTDLIDRIKELEQQLRDPERTIRAAALELLCKVEYHEDRNKSPGPDNVVSEAAKGARSVGVPYDEIIRRIKDEFPEAQTTVACLRWYAVKVRAEEHGYEGLRLPQRRPRVKPVKK